MAKYQYNAVGKQGKNLTGIIEADNEENARKKLNKLQLSVISITKVDKEENTESNFNKFKFEARDTEDKKVIGTISSRDLLSAFKRLIQEYNLKVIKLASITASQQQFDESTNQVTKLYSEIEILEKNKKSDNTAEIIKTQKKQRKFKKTIDDIILVISTILTKHKADLRPEAVTFFEKYQNHLLKIKNSENFDNLVSSAIRALEEIEKAKIFIDEKTNKEEKLNLRLQAMNLKELLKEQKPTKNPLTRFIEKLGLNKKITQKKSGGTPHFKYLKLLFTTKSKELKKHLISNFFNKILSIVKPPAKSLSTQKPQKTEKQANWEKIAFNITTGLLIGYMTYYFLAVFISEKILNRQVSGIFYIYNTSLLVYIIIGVIFLHSAIRLRSLLDEHKINHSKITYTLFSVLYLLIIINF